MGSHSPGIVADEQRHPPRPVLERATCEFCHQVGIVVTRQYYAGGQGWVFRKCCPDVESCQRRCDESWWDGVPS